MVEKHGGRREVVTHTAYAIRKQSETVTTNA